MISDLPSYDIFVPRKVPRLKIFDDVIASDLWFGPPNQKFSLRQRIGDGLKNFFEDLFFFWRTLAAVSLASTILVLGLERVCPRKGCSWPRIFFVSLALTSSLVSSTTSGYNAFIHREKRVILATKLYAITCSKTICQQKNFYQNFGYGHSLR